MIKIGKEANNESADRQTAREAETGCSVRKSGTNGYMVVQTLSYPLVNDETVYRAIGLSRFLV